VSMKAHKPGSVKPQSIVGVHFLVLIALAGSMACSAATASADKKPGACPMTAEQPLAFWFGRWEVYSAGKLDGHSSIESTLQGCAVVEHWDDVSGFKGMSLFYFEPHVRQWKQVWVTDHAFSPGGLKEKALVYSTADLVRFQGTVWVASDRMVIDRTTLRKLDGGTLSQVIEYSKDGGATWIKTYDAVYRPAATDDLDHRFRIPVALAQ
jgi:hypothetical protein